MPRLRLTARPAFPLALLISLASGLVASLAFPPTGWWPVAFVAVIPLLWLLSDARPLRGFCLGLAFGLGFYGATLYWILRFGLMGWTALVLLMAAWVGLFGLLTPAVRQRSRPFLSVVGLASLWTVLDWLRGSMPLGGFTWGSLGISQVDNRITLRLATLTGVWGVTFVVVAVNGLLCTALSDGVLRDRLIAIVAGVILIVGPGAIPYGAADGATLDVAAIQVDVRQARASTASAEDVGVAALNIREHAGLAADPPDLAVWGEGALDPAAAGSPTVRRAVQQVVARVGSPTLVGAVTSDPDGRERTNVLLFGPNGELAGRYDKVHLVPFGEYVPFRDELSWIDAIDQVPVDRAPGERVHTLSVGTLPPFGTPICFENSFPQIPRAFVRDGATFLVVTVNNASYGFTAASDQHLQMSQMRSVETARWVVNAAVSGVSAFIDPQGRVVAREELFTSGILRTNIRASDQQTWYVRLGDWLPWLALALVIALFLLPRRRVTPGRPPDALPAGFRSLLILPTFDEAATIERVLMGVLGAPQHVDAIVIDDSSPDGTGEMVRNLAASEPRIRLVERPQKSGLASAYLHGFGVGLDEGYDLIVEMDSDLSHDPTELPRLLEAAAAGNDLTIGSRYVTGGSVTNWSRPRVALSRAGNTYARLMLGIPVKDATSGFRVYRRAALADLVRRPFTADGYGFQIELVMRAWDLGYTLGEAPITFREREHGHSKISRRIVVEALWLVTRWGMRARFRGRPASGMEAP